MAGVDELVGVAGHPIDHSLSPQLHEAAFRALGLNWESRRYDVSAGGGAQLVETMRTLRLRGLSVTMPLKEEVAACVDELDEQARLLGSVNTLVLEHGRVLGLSTDGLGLLDALRHSKGFEPAGTRAVIVGAGGAARAVAAALGSAGAAEITVVARRPDQAQQVALLAGPSGRVGSPTDAAVADVIIETTPVGMADTPHHLAASLVDPELLHQGQLAVDLVYHPRRTLWLDAAARSGAETEGGLGMLVHQAARAIERWVGQPAPVAAMWAAASEAL